MYPWHLIITLCGLMLVDYYFVIIIVTTFFALIFLWVLGGFSFFFNFHFLSILKWLFMSKLNQQIAWKPFIPTPKSQQKPLRHT